MMLQLQISSINKTMVCNAKLVMSFIIKTCTKAFEGLKSMVDMVLRW